MARNPRTTQHEIEQHRRLARAYFQRNKDKAKALSEACRLKRVYGITPEQLEVLKQRQNRRCANCQKQARLVVDHCHESGKVRGLLCHGCNTGLGQLGDSIEGLQRAIHYLQNPPTLD